MGSQTHSQPFTYYFSMLGHNPRDAVHANEATAILHVAMVLAATQQTPAQMLTSVQSTPWW